MKGKYYAWPVLSFLTGLLLLSCSTEKNTFITRTYHNLTSHYNIFFNGNESFKKGLKKIEDSYQEDYSRMIPVFNYGDENMVGSITPDMDRAQKKALKVIELHSITAKPDFKKGSLSPKQKEFLKKNEYNKWVDDNYLLIGKAHFYKRDYNLAIQTFRYMLREFPENPIKYDALLWMAKAFNQLEEYKESLEVLTLLDSERKFPDKLKWHLNATFADYYMKQDQYENAIPRLRKALDKVRGKDKRIRYTYILAQLNQKSGNYKKAYNLYGKVIKMNPPYEMTFNAKINMAGSFQSGAVNSQSIKSELRKMLKDDKNIEFQDQIYYALAEIYFKEDNITEAIENYRLSAGASVNNDFQKAQSYLALADIYYERPDYMNAQAYYDSAVVFLDEEYPGYNIIYAKSQSLTDLITSIRNVELQDSVQHLASLSEEERFKVIDGIIQDLERKEREEKERERERMQNMRYNRMMNNTGRSPSNQGGGGKFYFYNLSAKSFGQAEFKLKWGNRKLEDNWRRKNKKTVSMGELTELQEENTEEGKPKITDKKSREYYLQDIPLTDSAMEKSHMIIKESLLNVGMIYKNDLKDNDQSVEAFEDLIRRYPGSDIAQSAYYNLYVIHKNLGNSVKAENYKNILISKYPESLYGKVLTNPDYFKELEKEEKKVSNFYIKTLNAFQAGEYNTVLQNTDFAANNYKEDELYPKFVYLKALSYGKLGNISMMRDKLTELTETYPGSEMNGQARQIIALLDEEHPDVKEEVDKQIAQELYFYNQKEPHYFAFVVDSKVTDVNQLVFNIINFNLDHFEKLDLTANSEDLEGKQKIILVKPFKSYKKSLEYYSQITGNGEIFRDTSKEGSFAFIISEKNLQTLQEDKVVARYVQFFNMNYL